MTPEQQERLMDTIAGAIQDVPQEIVYRQISHFFRTDPAYGEGVAKRMDMSLEHPI